MVWRKIFQHFAYRQRNRDTHISDKSSGWHCGTPKIFSAVTKQSMYRQKNQMLTEIEPVVRCAWAAGRVWAAWGRCWRGRWGSPSFRPPAADGGFLRHIAENKTKKNIYGAHNAKSSFGFGERENDVLATRLPNWGARPPRFSIRGTRPPGQAPTHIQAHLTLCFSTAVKCLSRDCSSWVNLKTKQNSAIIGYLKMSMYHCLI